MSTRPINKMTERSEEFREVPIIPSDENPFLIEHVRDYLEALGARVNIQKGGYGRKANLLATFGYDGEGTRDLWTSTQVVAAEGQVCGSDSSTMKERDVRLYGRETGDLEGLLACAMATAREIASLQLTKPLHLAFTYDERRGSNKMPTLSRVWWE
ncbi:hypothetical protein ACDY97_25565 [Rhizobium mongolense]|uniref:hypothetical protein n=1 Tax=Rhizobium mongolense TaxID=57676 RepID=UPI003557B086